MTIERLLSMKELADELGRSYSYVKAMRRRGFRMIAGRTTLRAAITFLAKVDKPCGRMTAIVPK